MIVLKLGHWHFTSFLTACSERLTESMHLGWQAVRRVFFSSNTSSPILMGWGDVYVRQVAKAQRLWCQRSLALNPCFSTYCESLSKLFKLVELRIPQLLKEAGETYMVIEEIKGSHWWGLISAPRKSRVYWGNLQARGSEGLPYRGVQGPRWLDTVWGFTLGVAPTPLLFHPVI